VIRTTVVDDPTDTDSMTVKDVFRDEPVVDTTTNVITVTGWAREPGTTTPLDNIEIRLNHPGGTWDATGAGGRKDWRVAGDIAANGEFVARFTGGSEADLTAVKTAEVAAEFAVGGEPPSEITVYDGLSDGPCGPAATTAITSVTPSVVNAAAPDGMVTVSGLHASGVTGIKVDGVDAVLNGGTWTAAVDVSGKPEGTIDLPVVYAGSTAPPNQTARVMKDTTAPGPVTSDLASGTYPGAQTIHLTGENQVRYTTDGSTPSATSQLYGGAITVTSTRTIKALAIDAAGNPGPVASFAYTITTPVSSPLQPRVITNTVVQQVPVAGAVAGANAASVLPARLTLGGLTMRKVVARRAVRANGLSAVMRLKSGTKVLRIRIYRKQAGGKRSLVAERFQSPAAGGLYRMRLKDRSLRRALTAGSYEAQLAPGRTRSSFGKTSKLAFRVTP
jgi:Chitobiase/beta-hexosaminidase C-terminal domain